MTIHTNPSVLPSLVDDVGALSDVDWSDADRLYDRIGPVLRRLSESSNLRALLAACESDERLHGLSDRNEWGDQLALMDLADCGVRIRLNTYRDSDFQPHARIHSHRFSFASIILRGEFRHSFYGDIDSVVARVDGNPLRPSYTSVARPGTVYAFTSTGAHAVTAVTGSVSMLIRGPAMAKSSIVFNESGTAPAIRKLGRADESAAGRVHVETTAEFVRSIASSISAEPTA